MTASWDSECTSVFVFPKYLQEKPSWSHEPDAAMKLCMWEIHALALLGWKGHCWHSYKGKSHWTPLYGVHFSFCMYNAIFHLYYFASFCENKMITSFPFPFTPCKLLLSYFSFSLFLSSSFLSSFLPFYLPFLLPSSLALSFF